ncbi:MAG: type II toxin-antitoxin system PemK/MazF family toxin [Cellulomonadaceae bacterium]|jgi:mRNA interferase MazF|nr:type II toxin-antitoxin system PemK/MazF family toxin [Cellulomonadaceae bacterium]
MLNRKYTGHARVHCTNPDLYYGTKPRPVLILQQDAFSETDSVTVVFITTYQVNAPLLRIPLPATAENGLHSDSFLMIDKVTTVRRSHLGETLGKVPPSVMTAVERAVAVFLGIA